MANSDDINTQKDNAHAAAQAALDQALPTRDQSSDATNAYMTLLDTRNSLYLADLQAALDSPELAQALAVISSATSRLTTMAAHMTNVTSIVGGAANFANQGQVVVTAFQNAQAKIG